MYLLLTFLAWGLFAFDTGLWQDAVNSLARALRGEGPLGGFVAAGVTVTRRLKSVIYAVAVRSDHPLIVLHIVSGMVWLGQGLLADRLARQIFGPQAWVGVVAGGLTLCATADLLTGSLVGLGYQTSVLAFLGATTLLVSWYTQGGRTRFVGSAALLMACLWTSDGLVTSLVLVPLLLWTLPQRNRRRLQQGVLVWGLVALPYFGLLLAEFVQDDGYPHRALLSLSIGEWAARALNLFVYNFTPWRWLDHPLPFATAGPEHLVPLWVYVAAALVGTLSFLVVLLRLYKPPAGSAQAAAEPERPSWQTLIVLALMVLSVNGAFALVHVSDLFYRTHLVSRVWASLLVTGVTLRLVLARRSLSRPALALPALFLACGLWGGVERQDFFAGSWRLHRAEVVSILEAVPSLSPDSVLILIIPREPTFLATEASYLASAWSALLYRDPTMSARTVLWSPDRRTGCRFEPEGLACWSEGQQACFAAGSCPGISVPYERAVALRYSSHTGRYALEEDLHALADGTLPNSARRYAPHQQIVPRAPDPWVESLLRESRFLGRILLPPGRPGLVRSESAKISKDGGRQ